MHEHVNSFPLEFSQEWNCLQYFYYGPQQHGHMMQRSHYCMSPFLQILFGEQQLLHIRSKILFPLCFWEPFKDWRSLEWGWEGWEHLGCMDQSARKCCRWQQWRGCMWQLSQISSRCATFKTTWCQILQILHFMGKTFTTRLEFSKNVKRKMIVMKVLGSPISLE